MEKYKVILAGNIHIDYGAEACISRALKRQGHKVIDVFYPTYKSDYSAFNDALENTIKNEKPNIVIAAKCMGLTNEIISRLKKTYGVPIIQWHFDLMKTINGEDRTKWWFPQMSAFDAVFGANGNPEDVKIYRQHNPKYHVLREGVDPSLHYPLYEELSTNENNKYKADVCFTGSLYNDFRWKIVNNLSKEGIFKFKHYSDLRLDDLRKMVSVTDMAICTNYDDYIPYYWSARTYENAGLRMAILTPNIKGLKDEGFRHKKTCFNYNIRDFEDLKELIEYWSRPENVADLINVQEQGSQMVHKNHSYDKRIEDLWRILKNDKIL